MNQKNTNAKILITGADGFIGSDLTEALVSKASLVRVFVMCKSLNSWGLLDHFTSDVKGQFQVFAGDFRDSYGLKEAIKVCDEVRMLPQNSELQSLWADNAKAKRLFGWQPSYSRREGFKCGQAETAKWFTQSNNLLG